VPGYRLWRRRVESEAGKFGLLQSARSYRIKGTFFQRLERKPRIAIEVPCGSIEAEPVRFFCAQGPMRSNLSMEVRRMKIDPTK